MGWRLPWVSSSPGDFNFDLGFSQTEEQSRQAVAQVQLPRRALEAPGQFSNEDWDAFPPIVEQNARSTGTDIGGYLTESPGFSTFVRDGDDVYHAYSTTWRGLEFVMTYYPILDHAPKGRDEGEEDWQLWIRRHDEYEASDVSTSAPPARPSLRRMGGVTHQLELRQESADERDLGCHRDQEEDA